MSPLAVRLLRCGGSAPTGGNGEVWHSPCRECARRACGCLPSAGRPLPVYQRGGGTQTPERGWACVIRDWGAASQPMKHHALSRRPNDRRRQEKAGQASGLSFFCHPLGGCPCLGHCTPSSVKHFPLGNAKSEHLFDYCPSGKCKEYDTWDYLECRSTLAVTRSAAASRIARDSRKRAAVARGMQRAPSASSAAHNAASSRASSGSIQRSQRRYFCGGWWRNRSSPAANCRKAASVLCPSIWSRVVIIPPFVRWYD